jgi:hypothetical protein
VADRSSQLVVSALSRAAAETGLPLHGSKTQGPGLFPGTALGKQAAQRCCEEGYLQTVPGAGPSGRTANQVCTLTDKGRAFLLSQLSPRQVLEDFVRVLEAREGQMAQLLVQVKQLQSGLETLRNSIAPVLDQVRQAETHRNLNGLCREFRQEEPPPAPREEVQKTPSDPGPLITQALQSWAKDGSSEDYPLPELFRQVRAAMGPGLSLGSFHDALRRLQDAGTIYLHPWTGPLYEMPEPPCSLLVGHEIAYYASIRREG